ncbi:(R)-mandelonitrile lyase [Anaeromyxobacter dehalogenans]|nr:carboxymuconolactone decarboxylase family protein [Anaeromyxobacter dehalogenans]
MLPPLVLLAMAVFVHGCAHQQATSRGTTVTTDGLSVKQQRLVAIAAFTANGNLPKLSTALAGGLDAGWTINEIKEVLVQLYAYAGFPRSLNGLNTFIDVLDDRQRRGITDEVGREPSPMPAHKSSIELGTEIQTKLVGGPATGRYVAFCPGIDAFLKGHLFGDILGRDNLDVQSREIATISALATLEGVNPQLTSHFNVGLNTGLTEAQLRGVTFAIDDAVGKARGDNARHLLAQVIGKRPGMSHPDTVLSTGRGSSAEARISIRVRQEQLVESAPLEHFKGTVRIRRLFQASDPARASGASVTFEPGARTAWHAHPLGQVLVVTAGTGWVQQRGEAAKAIREDDVVWIPPAVMHWHGATTTTAMTHMAVQERLDDNTVEWMEQVSDEQYRAAEQTR